MKRKKRSMKELVAQSSPRLSKDEVEEIGGRVWKNLEAAMAKQDLSLRSLYGDGWNAPPLNQDEFQVLTAASLLEGQGTAGAILRKARQWGGSEMLPIAFDSLEAEGLLVALGTPDQGPAKLKVTELGERALGRAKAEGKQLVLAREGVAEKVQAAAEEGNVEGGSAERIR